MSITVNDDEIIGEAMVEAAKAWKEEALEESKHGITLGSEGILDVVLKAAAPVFRKRYLEAAKNAMETWAETIDPTMSEYHDGRQDGAYQAIRVIERMQKS